MRASFQLFSIALLATACAAGISAKPEDETDDGEGGSAGSSAGSAGAAGDAGAAGASGGGGSQAGAGGKGGTAGTGGSGGGAAGKGGASGGSAGTSSGGASGGGAAGGSGKGGTAGSGTAGSAGSGTAGSAGSGTAGSAGSGTAGSSGSGTAGSGGTAGGASGSAGSGGSPAVCGNGTIDPGEECDDGNSNTNDRCTNKCKVQCDSSEGKLGTHCYWESTSTDSWTSAKAFCETVSGGHLVTITSQAEADFVWKYMSATIWIGYTDSATEGTFAWVTGEPSDAAFASKMWASGEPNDAGGNEDCAEFKYNNEEWNDNACSKSQYYWCEIEPAGKQP